MSVHSEKHTAENCSAGMSVNVKMSVQSERHRVENCSAGMSVNVK